MRQVFRDMTRKKACNPEVTPQIPSTRHYGGSLMSKLLRQHKTKPGSNQSSAEDVRAHSERFLSIKHVLELACEGGAVSEFLPIFWLLGSYIFKVKKTKQMYWCKAGSVTLCFLLNSSGARSALSCSLHESKKLPKLNKKLWRGQAKRNTIAHSNFGLSSPCRLKLWFTILSLFPPQSSKLCTRFLLNSVKFKSLVLRALDGQHIPLYIKNLCCLVIPAGNC